MQNAELYNRMGLCQLDAGKISDALDYFEQGLSHGRPGAGGAEEAGV